jgi:hypothetical protein
MAGLSQGWMGGRIRKANPEKKKVHRLGGRVLIETLSGTEAFCYPIHTLSKLRSLVLPSRTKTVIKAVPIHYQMMMNTRVWSLSGSGIMF